MAKEDNFELKTCFCCGRQLYPSETKDIESILEGAHLTITMCCDCLEILTIEAKQQIPDQKK